MTTCERPGCGQTAGARVAYPLLDTQPPGHGFVIVRPPDSPVAIGKLLCMDCAHSAVDDMLMAAMPASPGPALEQREDGAA